jgi:hypothetical protein
LVDLVKDHIEDIKPIIEDVIGDVDNEDKVVLTACKRMNERGG